MDFWDQGYTGINRGPRSQGLRIRSPNLDPESAGLPSWLFGLHLPLLMDKGKPASQAHNEVRGIFGNANRLSFRRISFQGRDSVFSYLVSSRRLTLLLLTNTVLDVPMRLATHLSPVSEHCIPNKIFQPREQNLPCRF